MYKNQPRSTICDDQGKVAVHPDLYMKRLSLGFCKSRIESKRHHSLHDGGVGHNNMKSGNSLRPQIWGIWLMPVLWLCRNLVYGSMLASAATSGYAGAFPWYAILVLCRGVLCKSMCEKHMKVLISN